MGLTFFRKATNGTNRLGARVAILPGAFNPPTRAHLALAYAALDSVDEVLFVLPREMPHKTFAGVSFAERIALVMKATEQERRFSVGSSEGGLFIEIAREAREYYVGDLAFLCGRDAAERVVNWDYGSMGTIAEILEEFELLVASRNGDYYPPEALRHRSHSLYLPEPYDHVAATEVRNRIGHDESWRKLVPEAIEGPVEDLYARLID